MDAPKHSLGTSGGDDCPLGPFHPSAFWGQSPGGMDQQRGWTRSASCRSLAQLQGQFCCTHMLWRTHQPQWGSREPRHSSQLSYCSQLSTGTRVTCREQARSEGAQAAVPTPSHGRDRPSIDSPWPVSREAGEGAG